MGVVVAGYWNSEEIAYGFPTFSWSINKAHTSAMVGAGLDQVLASDLLTPANS